MAFVARTVTRKEYLNNSDALSALITEWNKLRTAKVWDENEVQEWAKVKADADAEGRNVHVGSLQSC